MYVRVTSLPPDMDMYMCMSGGRKFQFSEKFCIRSKRMVPVVYRKELSFNIDFVKLQFQKL